MVIASNSDKAIETFNPLQTRGGVSKDAKPYYMRHWDEILGLADSVEIVDGHCIAAIGKIAVLLPLEFAARLIEVKGKRVAILRTDKDFRMRIIQSSNPNAKPSQLVIVKDPL